jgi:hypothetical protein
MREVSDIRIMKEMVFLISLKVLPHPGPSYSLLIGIQ